MTSSSKQGFETVSTAAGLAQFYDRDAPAAMAKAGMEGFQEFMLDTSKMMAILERLDGVPRGSLQIELNTL